MIRFDRVFKSGEVVVGGKHYTNYTKEKLVDLMSHYDVAIESLWESISTIPGCTQAWVSIIVRKN